MRDMVAMLDQAKYVERKEVSNPKAEILQEIPEQIQIQDQAQTTKTLAERVQMIEAKLKENLIDQILNDDDLLILIDDLHYDVNLAATIGLLPS